MRPYHTMARRALYFSLDACTNWIISGNWAQRSRTGKSIIHSPPPPDRSIPRVLLHLFSVKRHFYDKINYSENGFLFIYSEAKQIWKIDSLCRYIIESMAPFVNWRLRPDNALCFCMSIGKRGNLCEIDPSHSRPHQIKNGECFPNIGSLRLV